jgi:ATP-dependent DNA helicase RecQ
MRITSPDQAASAYASALAHLARHYGHDAFRPAQDRVVRSVLAGRDTLGILPTGGGKSVCFQVPALVRGGLTVVISPLVALMQDQVDAAVRRGLPAAALHSAAEAAARADALSAARAGTLRLLYVSPERAPRLVDELGEAVRSVGLLAVDEAHCIAEWGHDFRPSYRALGALRARLGDPPVVALTGSATPAVRAEIAAALGLGGSRPLSVEIGSFDRPNLRFAVRRVRDDAERRAALRELVPRGGPPAIVYAPTRNLTEALARQLLWNGRCAAPYHAGLTAAERRRILDDFLAGRLDAIAATSAFGMGIDKPDVRTVLHWCMPPTPESYYQEAGRAGRDGGAAACVLLAGRDDATLHTRLLDVTFPAPRLVERIWAGREDPRRLASGIAASAERLRAELRPSPGGRVDWGPVRRRRAAAAGRIRAMRRYAFGRRCRRASLLDYFGERLGACAGCDCCDRAAGGRRWSWPAFGRG